MSSNPVRGVQTAAKSKNAGSEPAVESENSQQANFEKVSGHKWTDIEREIDRIIEHYKSHKDLPLTEFKSNETWSVLEKNEDSSISSLNISINGSPLVAYKIKIKFFDVNPIQLCYALLDINNRKELDESTIKIEQNSKFKKSLKCDIINSVNKYPTPFNNRSYQYFRKWKSYNVGTRKIYCILSKSLKSINQSDKSNDSGNVGFFKNIISKSVEYAYGSGDIIVDQYYSVVAIENDPNIPNQTNLVMIYYEDPKLNVPQNVLYKAVIASFPKYAASLSKIAKMYNV
ncbi:MAG: hypothetical protein MHPSP_000521 [Paramarteilia canceri]